jgi:FAD/FMN-containing dehydrogenase
VITISSIEEYQAKCAILVSNYQLQQKNKSSIQLKKNTSNLFRHRKQSNNKLDARSFNNVLQIDLDKKIVYAEGMITFADLVDVTLQHGFLPAVVPELKTITLGGAIAGIGIESSSFIYGLVHEAIIELDILTGNGDIITANKDNEHKDLFLGFPNSYGTLGYTLRAAMRLIPCSKYIKLTHKKFNDTNQYYQAIQDYCTADTGDKSKFIDGSIFNDELKILTTAECVSNEDLNASKYTYNHIYYKSIQTKQTDYLSTHDYIWRWDSDWFWCSKTFGMENIILRLILGKWLLKSKSYWKVKSWFDRHPNILKLYNSLSKRREQIIQDVIIPLESAEEFYVFFRDNIGITPIWNCPVRATETKFTFFPLEPNKLYINFGFWSSIVSDKPDGHFNRLIEQEVTKLNGHKSLYSTVHYTKEEFWSMYDQDKYNKLKDRYDPKGNLANLYTKCTTTST